jgi:hypothetical protein
MKRFAMITLAAFGALLATAPGALAQSPPDVTCPPYAGSMPSTVHNVTVPNQQTCTLGGGFRGVTVTGDVRVGQGATFMALGSFRSRVTISGNVQGNNCNFVQLSGTVVGGNVQIGNCASGGTVDDGATVGGDLQCHNNTGPCDVENSTIGGNVQIMNNTSATASVINDNIIAKNLQCQGNSPPPTGGGNMVGGNREGQCESF